MKFDQNLYYMECFCISIRGRGPSLGGLVLANFCVESASGEKYKIQTWFKNKNCQTNINITFSRHIDLHQVRGNIFWNIWPSFIKIQCIVWKLSTKNVGFSHFLPLIPYNPTNSFIRDEKNCLKKFPKWYWG